MSNTTKASSAIAEFVWHDREIRFDIPYGQLGMRPGEVTVDHI